jgi:hypothetical protein
MKMEDKKPEYIRKIKLKLEQPAIMCEGRKPITCYYKGKVILESENLMWIVIKSHGKEISLMYDKNLKHFLHRKDGEIKEFEDLKIIE